MDNVIGYQKASVRAAEIVNEAGIVGQLTKTHQLLVDASSVNRGFSVRFERAWSVECLLSIGFDVTRAKSQGYEILKPKVRVTWPTMQHDVVSAVAALALVQEVVAVAALIELTLSRVQILDRHNRDEK
jgi:hypothetical protein